jgi:hypothetical protein
MCEIKYSKYDYIYPKKNTERQAGLQSNYFRDLRIRHTRMFSEPPR